MSIDEQHVALPKLYGAPAYARPVAAPVTPTPRPFDPDQLPLTAQQTEDERRVADHLPAHTYVSSGERQVDPGESAGSDSLSGLRPRLFNLRAIAGRLLGGD